MDNQIKAPDKIYLEPYLDYPDKLHPSWYRYDIIGSGVEYIRKDALLEWANKELKDSVGQYHNDYDLALSSLIDKLNEM